MTARVIFTGSVLSPLIFSPATVAKMTEDPTVLNDGVILRLIQSEWEEGACGIEKNTLVCG